MSSAENMEAGSVNAKSKRTESAGNILKFINVCMIYEFS